LRIADTNAGSGFIGIEAQHATDLDLAVIIRRFDETRPPRILCVQDQR
jgi:hypothetical protein